MSFKTTHKYYPNAKTTNQNKLHNKLAGGGCFSWITKKRGHNINISISAIVNQSCAKEITDAAELLMYDANGYKPTELLKTFKIYKIKSLKNPYGYLFITKLGFDIKEQNYTEGFIGVNLNRKWVLVKLELKARYNRYEFKGKIEKEIVPTTEIVDPTKPTITINEIQRVPSVYTSNIKELAEYEQDRRTYGKPRSSSAASSVVAARPTGSAARPTGSATGSAARPTGSAARPTGSATGSAARPPVPARPPRPTGTKDEFSIYIVSDLENTFYGYTQKEVKDLIEKIFALDPNDTTNNVFNTQVLKINKDDGKLIFLDTTTNQQYELTMENEALVLKRIINNNIFLYIKNDNSMIEHDLNDQEIKKYYYNTLIPYIKNIMHQSDA